MSAPWALPALLARSGSGARGLLAWWGAGLAACLPARWRVLLAAGGDRLLLQPQPDGLGVLRQREGGVRALAVLPLPLPAGADPLARLLREPARALPRWLVLPATLGLRRTLLLPAAAGERLRDVLAFEIERQTPFAAEAVLYDGRVLQAREDGQLLVELVVLPKRQLEAATAGFGALVDGLTGLDLADAEGHGLGLNLLPPAQRQRRRDPWQRWNLGLAVLALLALVAGLAQLLDNRRAALATLQAAVAQRETAAHAVATQRQRVLDAVEGGAWLRAQRNDRASTVEVMDALAQRLPDGTYLEKLAVDGDQVTLIGLSNQAAALVGKLEGAPQWTAPALSGALQQDPRTRMDRFTLLARLAHAPAPAPVAGNGGRQDAR